ncbi:MAG: hypothetical protein K2M17_04595 [Bacilli bacterium]|nr:hypothetical protein [Bacilli bacterium]
MSFFKKMRSIFHDDCCSSCGENMDVKLKQLYMLPMMVGHYESHQDPEYYMGTLIRVHKKCEIPTGCYACGIVSYQCPNCGERLVKLSIFLPVRDEEKLEEYIYFKNGELDEFLFNTRI